MEEQSKHLKHHFVFKGSKGPLGITLTQEDVAIVNIMYDKYPGKYEGGEGILQAIFDYRRENEGKE